MRGRPRPAALTGPALSLVAMAGAIYVISRTTGSGWLLVLFSGVIAVVLLSAFLPARALSGVELRLDAPRDATVAHPVMVKVIADGGVRTAQLRLVDPPGEWVRLDGPATGDLRALPRRRGVLRSVELELRSAAPFGLVWWHRSVRVALRRPLEVGPEPLDVPAPSPPSGTGGDAVAGRPSASTGDTLRTVRHYVDGDPLRLVSWPATARHGRLMVKELEAPETTGVIVVVELHGSEDEAEDTARRAAGLANAALAAGMAVVLVTSEVGGPCIGPVTSPVEIGRRLARAVGGVPPATPATAGHVVLSVGGT